MKDIVIAMITPTLSIIAMRALVMYLLKEDEGGEKEIDGEDAIDIGPVQFLCFVLAGLSLSNEVHEGMCKLVFSLRACTGVYEGVCPVSLSLGVVLGTFQVLCALVAMALNMQLVACAETLLDCFMNFVAVGFFAEIDNLVMSSRTLKGWMKDYEGPSVEVTRVILEKRSADSSHASDLDVRAWLTVLLYCTMGVVLGTFSGALIAVWAGAVRDPPQHVDWLPMLPRAAAVIVVLNVLVYGTSRLSRPADVLIVAALGFQVFLIVCPHTGSILVRNVLFVYSIFGIALGAAVDHDPFAILWCPCRLPFSTWVLMFGASNWMQQLRLEGVA